MQDLDWATKQRNQMMIDKLSDQVARGYIEREWDIDFIYSLKTQIKTKRPLSDKQTAKLEELFERY